MHCEYETEFKDKVVLITGGAAGIGAAAVRLFADCGSHVVFADTDCVQSEKIVADAKQRGLSIAFCEADVSTSFGCKSFIDRALSMYGRADVLYNNVGIEIAAPFIDMTEAQYDRLFDVNVRSIFLCCQQVIPHMMRQGGGSIVNAASVAAERAWPNDVVYSATKGAVKLMTQGLAVEYATHGIRVNAVAPGVIDTPMTDRALKDHPCLELAKREKGLVHPIGRLGLPQEVAHAVLFLCSSRASFISGAMLPVDGAFLAG